MTPNDGLQLLNGLEVYEFGENVFEKHLVKDFTLLKEMLHKPTKFWINVYGVQNEEILNALAEIFEIHSLTLEDIKNLQQRPKFEEFDQHIFIVTKILHIQNQSSTPLTEQVSILFGTNYILSIQENELDIFDPIRVRLENPKGRMRRFGTDYFAYTLLDAIMDQYYLFIENTADRTELLEELIIKSPHKFKLESLFRIRKVIQEVRKTLRPTRELIANWRKAESKLLQKKTIPFINDIYEYIIEINESLETQKESIITLETIFMTNISLKQNEVMKTLTIIATIFIPLTFIAGIYGMNFEGMPELTWPFGYAMVWVVFFIVTLGMIVYFKSKKWF